MELERKFYFILIHFLRGGELLRKKHRAERMEQRAESKGESEK
jgi:hypothetical protein